jgi:chromosome partitioning protein
MSTPASAHVVVLGNEKGGSGKSTTAMHMAVALMHVGQRVATIDLDSRQRSLTRYLENRRAWARRAHIDLKVPMHFCVARGSGLKLDENEAIEFAGFAEAVGAVEQSHDFVVVDTPGTDSYLTRLAHSMADTLITPLNDSFVDLDVIGTIDASTFAVIGESHYATMVRDARRQRRMVDGTRMDWVVVRNRLSMLGSRNKRLVREGLGELAARLGFRCADGLAERVNYREFFRAGSPPSTISTKEHWAREHSQCWRGLRGASWVGCGSSPRSSLAPPGFGKIAIQRGRRRPGDPCPAGDPLLGEMEQGDCIHAGDQHTVERAHRCHQIVPRLRLDQRRNHCVDGRTLDAHIIARTRLIGGRRAPVERLLIAG